MGKKKKGRFLKADTERVAYFARENLAQQPAKYAVGVITKEGTLDLYPSLPIFKMQAIVKGVKTDVNAPKGPVRDVVLFMIVVVLIVSPPKDTLLEQRKLLVESFGSKKKKTEACVI